MKIIKHPRPNEQRKVEELLVKLANIKPISGKPVTILNSNSALKTA